jgi:hypothetical protein
LMVIRGAWSRQADSCYRPAGSAAWVLSLRETRAEVDCLIGSTPMPGANLDDLGLACE